MSPAIARYDDINREWISLPYGGLNSTVTSMAVLGQELYVAGGSLPAKTVRYRISIIRC